MSKLQPSSAFRPATSEVPGLSYFIPEAPKPAPQPPVPMLSALEQMFAYFD